LEKRADIDFADAKGMTPLHYAVKRNHEDCTEYLLACGANVNAEDQVVPFQNSI
jgi:ankyrin repeat protein